MKLLSLVIVICVSTSTADEIKDIFSSNVELCNNNEDVIEDYQQALYSFAVQMYKNVGGLKAINNHFVFSSLSVWIILAAIAEAVDLNTKLAMFQFLRLPIDPCVRLKYYQLATSPYVFSNDISILNTRALVIDEEVTINPTYNNFVFKHSLLDVVSAPIRHDPQTALKEIRRVMSAKLSNLELYGNSVILDAVDYNGLWNTAFEDAVVERSPFYNRAGEQIGSVDLMKVRRRVRRTYLRSVNMKIIELPIGANERYRMLFGLILDHNVARVIKDFEETILKQYLSSVKESLTPIDIAIPRFNITSEYDLKQTLSEFGVRNLWTEPAVTRSISEPAALPSGFLQRSTISVDKAGLEPAPLVHQFSNISTEYDPVIGHEFILNRPFLLALFDSDTWACILVAGFTQPTYKI